MAHAYAAAHATEAGARGYPPAAAGWPDAALGLHGYGLLGHHPPATALPYGVPGASPYPYHAGLPPQLHASAASSAWYQGAAAGYDAHLYASGVQAKLPLPPAPGHEYHQQALMAHMLHQQQAAQQAAAAAAALGPPQLSYPHAPQTPPLRPSDPAMPPLAAAALVPPGFWNKAVEERARPSPPPVLPQGLEAPPGISGPAVSKDASSRKAEIGELISRAASTSSKAAVSKPVQTPPREVIRQQKPQQSRQRPSDDPGAAAGAFLLHLMNKEKEPLESSGAALLQKLQKGSKVEDAGSVAGMALLQQVQSGSPPRTADAEYSSGQRQKGPGKGKGEWWGGEDEYASNDYYADAGYYGEGKDASRTDRRWAKGGKASKKGKNAEWSGWTSADSWSGDWTGSEEWQGDTRWRQRKPAPAAPAESKTKSGSKWIAAVPQTEEKEKPKLKWRPAARPQECAEEKDSG